MPSHVCSGSNFGSEPAQSRCPIYTRMNGHPELDRLPPKSVPIPDLIHLLFAMLRRCWRRKSNNWHMVTSPVRGCLLNLPALPACRPSQCCGIFSGSEFCAQDIQRPSESACAAMTSSSLNLVFPTRVFSLSLLLDEPQPRKTNGEDHHDDENGVLYHRSPQLHRPSLQPAPTRAKTVSSSDAPQSFNCDVLHVARTSCTPRCTSLLAPRTSSLTPLHACCLGLSIGYCQCGSGCCDGERQQLFRKEKEPFDGRSLPI